MSNHMYAEGGGGATSVLPNNLAYTPDYQALLESDPAFQALAQHISAQDVSNAASRQSGTEQALIQFGMIPDFQHAAAELGLSPEALGMLMHDIDPHAAALAQQNTDAGLSTEAQLRQQQQQAVMALRNGLAARGALGSGDNAYRTNLQDQAYAKAQDNALHQLLAAINGYQGQYLAAHQSGQDQLNQGLQAAQQFEAGLPQNQGFTLHYDVKHGVYRDASGNTYHVHTNGNGTWTLTSSTGSTYTLGADGKLTSGGTAPVSAPVATAPVPTAPVAPVTATAPVSGGGTALASAPRGGAAMMNASPPSASLHALLTGAPPGGPGTFPSGSLPGVPPAPTPPAVWPGHPLGWQPPVTTPAPLRGPGRPNYGTPPGQKPIPAI